MELRCPDCASPEVSDGEQVGALACGNCGARFERGEALLSLADAEAHSACTCSDVRGCPQCFDRSERMVGALVRDAQGREWVVRAGDEKNGFPTVGGGEHWAFLHEVTVVREGPPSGGRRPGPRGGAKGETP